MIPGWVRNWFRTSRTTRCAARPTALISRLANMNTTEPPMITPTRTLGWSTDRLNVPALLPSACSIVVRKAPNSAVAASTAVAIAMPLVIALVVLPIASRWVSAAAPSPVTSPDISAMPCALSVTGPNESMDTITPTVVSRPPPAIATANKAMVAFPVASRYAPKTAAAISSAAYTADSIP